MNWRAIMLGKYTCIGTITQQYIFDFYFWIDFD